MEDDWIQVEIKLGKPKRISDNVYGYSWNTYYNNDYENFLMITYDKYVNITYLHTNQNLLTFTDDITFDNNKPEIRKEFVIPLSLINLIGSDTYHLDKNKNTVTFTYDTLSGMKFFIFILYSN